MLESYACIRQDFKYRCFEILNITFTDSTMWCLNPELESGVILSKSYRIRDKFSLVGQACSRVTTEAIAGSISAKIFVGNSRIVSKVFLEQSLWKLLEVSEGK